MPPALLVVGTKDILLEDNQRMAARWHAANGNAHLLVVPESPHAFMLMNIGQSPDRRASPKAFVGSIVEPRPRDFASHIDGLERVIGRSLCSEKVH
ncbi:alpha/beta hydrolase [Erythrobacter sp. QSSC1-22B]|uniref:alpha/beta hydrolase n=1 Tax=Erythrobacter sp. QSSC1-22B TaxID=1860125 RepID=UPI003516E567